eukprot:1138709-Pelagomonas_calceolata.AAC.10
MQDASLSTEIRNELHFYDDEFGRGHGPPKLGLAGPDERLLLYPPAAAVPSHHSSPPCGSPESSREGILILPGSNRFGHSAAKYNAKGCRSSLHSDEHAPQRRGSGSSSSSPGSSDFLDSGSEDPEPAAHVLTQEVRRPAQWERDCGGICTVGANQASKFLCPECESPNALDSTGCTRAYLWCSCWRGVEEDGVDVDGVAYRRLSVLFVHACAFSLVCRDSREGVRWWVSMGVFSPVSSFHWGCGLSMTMSASMHILVTCKSEHLLPTTMPPKWAHSLSPIGASKMGSSSSPIW